MKQIGRIFAFALPLTVLLFAGSTIVAARAGTHPRLFGSIEVRNNNLKPFPKWTGMLERQHEQKGKIDGSCQSRTFNRCHAERWQALIDSLRGKPLMEQLQTVNTFMNKARYIIDPVNWGVIDYWETPEQFFSKFGDCEDYAIAKYMTLKRLGVPVDDMRIVVLQDLNLGVAHAILAVYVGDQAMILDNQIKQVVNARTIHHYRPIFSINEKAWWLHRPAVAAARRTGAG